MDPFYIFPYEVWEDILERVQDAEDKLNLVRTNSKLKNAFHPNILGWQFLAILPIVAKNWSNNRALNTTLRNCRLISSNCCRVIDNYVNCHLTKFHCPPSFAKCKYNRNIRAYAEIFLQKIQQHSSHRSPLISKYLKVNWGLPADNNGQRGVALWNLVSKVGTHLKGIELSVFISSEIEISCRFLRDFLSLIPNTEVLMLSVIVAHYSGKVAEDIVLPPLPHLQILKMKTALILNSASPFASWINLNQYFSQLVELRLDFNVWKDQYNTNGLFPKLKRLRLSSVMLPEAEMKVYTFLSHLDTPKLEKLIFNTSWKILPVMNHYENSVYFLKTLVLFTLRKLRPECEWNVQETKVFGYVEEIIICC